MAKTLEELGGLFEKNSKRMSEIIEDAIARGITTREHLEEEDRKWAAMSHDEKIQAGLNIIKYADEILAKYGIKQENI